MMGAPSVAHPQKLLKERRDEVTSLAGHSYIFLTKLLENP
jgi:hypothetical protein